MPNKKPKKISRRGFLKKTGWVAAGLTVVAAASYPFVRSAIPILPTRNDPSSDDGLAWLQVLPDGSIRFYCPRMEMGQGAALGLAQIVAEELNVSQSQIECVTPSTDQVEPFKMTVGSEGIATLFEPISSAAARLREALRLMAAEKEGVDLDQIEDDRGGFKLSSGNKLSYGDLVPSNPTVLSVSDYPAADGQLERYAVKRKGNFRAIGQDWKHHELEAIVTGQTVYARDVSLPDMLYGQMLHPPAFGARLLSADGSAAESMAGVSAVVINTDANFVGVVAENPLVLSDAVEAVKAKWDMPEGVDQTQLDAILDVMKIRTDDDFEHVLVSDGDVSVGKNKARHKASARYDTSFAAHAAMEPRSALAWVREDKVEIWSGSQDPFFIQKRVAKAIDRAADEVVVHSLRMGGGFGGRVVCQTSDEAAILSKAVGRPVRVQWDRETEFQNTYYHPAFSHHIDAGVSEDGFISHWQHDFVSSPIIFGIVPAPLNTVIDMFVADTGTARGAVSQYKMENRQIRYSDIRTSVPIGPWRGLGAAPNGFAIESMMDELANKAGIDPLKFRLQNLPPESDRLAAVLRRVGEMADWDEPEISGIGRGIACAVYKDETAAAIVAEVQVDKSIGEIRVTRIWCAQDCGLVINPDQVENQIMGNIIWGCSMALKERLTFEAGEVEQDNFDGYEILRNLEAPEVEIALIEPADAAPVEVGESALAPVAPAIVNAKRARSLPIDFDSLA